MAELEILERLNNKLNSMTPEEFEEFNAKLENYKRLPREEYLKKLAELLEYNNPETIC